MLGFVVGGELVSCICIKCCGMICVEDVWLVVEFGVDVIGVVIIVCSKCWVDLV